MKFGDPICVECRKVPHERQFAYGICEACAKRVDYEAAVWQLIIEHGREQ